MGRNIIPIETEFQFPFGNQTGKVNAFLVIDGDKAALVDTLVQGKEAEIEKALKQAGLTWDAVEHIIITHAHPDHTGSLDAVLERAPNAQVHAGDELQLTVPVAHAHEGDIIFGLRVVEVPGHTSGSIALHDAALSAVILGDAAMNAAGNLTGPARMFTQDMDQGMKSLQKLTQLTFAQAFFGHGSSLDNDASDKLRQLV